MINSNSVSSDLGKATVVQSRGRKIRKGENRKNNRKGEKEERKTGRKKENRKRKEITAQVIYTYH